MTSRHVALVLAVLAASSLGCRRSPDHAPAPRAGAAPEAGPAAPAPAAPLAAAASPAVPAASPPAPGAAAAEFADLNWRAASKDGGAVVEQRGGADGCRVAARRGDAELWSMAACVARKSQLPFVSPDGLRLLVVDPLPDHDGPDWSGSVAALLFEKGALLRTVAAGDLVADARIRHMVKDFSWIAGAGEAQPPARYAGDGLGVEFRTVDGRAVKLAFDGRDFPTPRPVSRRAPDPAPREVGAAADERALYRWEDGDGSIHYGRRFEIPEDARARARPVDAQIGVMSVDPAPGAAAPPASTEPGGAGGAVAVPPPPPPPGSERNFYQRAVDLATGRPTADRPPDKKCRTEDGVTLCDP